MPDWKHFVRTQLSPMHVAPEREIEIIEELAAQLEQAYKDELLKGRSGAEAESIAKANLGTDWRQLAREIETAQARQHQPPARPWQGLLGDVQYAFRLLRKSPVFAIVAITTLALGIGGCTAIFSLIDAVILRPIGYRQPEQLVMVWEDRSHAASKNVVAMANYLDWKARNHVFSDMSPILDQIWNVNGQGGPGQLKGMGVNERFLTLLGVEPILGRGFGVDETKAGGPKVAILSHRVWVAQYGASRDSLGHKILLDGEPYVIIGILPSDFPWLGQPLDVLTPAQLPNRDWRIKAGRFLRVVARMKPGISFVQAQGELSTIARQLESEYPAFNKEWGVELERLSNHFAGEAGSALWILLGAVGIVLLIACSNVANLMLARSVIREREMALRAALGATRRRLLRQLTVESVLLASIGGALGCIGAYVAILLIQIYGPQQVARLDSAGLNPRIVLFALVVSCLTGIVFGLAPALHAGQLNPSVILKDGGRGVLNTIQGERLRSIFVVAQVGLALVLLTGATLLIQSLIRLNSVAVGFDPHNVLTGTVSLTGKLEKGQPERISQQMITQIKTIPGVENASWITWLPFTGQGAATGYTVVGQPAFAPGQTPVTDVRVVQPGYFETMHIALLQGRFFNEADNVAEAAPGFVVNEALARQAFGRRNPLGQNLIVQMGSDKPGAIIGVVADTKHKSLDGDVRPMVYYIQAQLPLAFGSFVVRTKSLNPESISGAMVAAIQQVKKDQPVTEIRTMDDWIGLSVARLRFQTAMLGAFALIAVILAVIGVYGVMAYSVEQRTHEMGVRMALGAEPGTLKLSIVLRGIRLACLGLAIGIAGAMASTRVLASQLYGVTAGDPLTFTTASILLAAACLAASYIPARRATLVDPVVALRAE